MRADNLTLLTDLYELTMMQGYFEKQSANETVIFDVFFRENPVKNGYSIMAGLEQVIEYIKNLNFSYEDVDYLISFQRKYLRDSGRKCDLPEGADLKSHRSDHGGTACGDCDLEYHQSSEPDRDKNSPCCPCGTGRRCHGIWSPPCSGTGCRTLWSQSRYDRRMCRHI